MCDMVGGCGSVAVLQPQVWTLMWYFLLLPVSPVWSLRGSERLPPPGQVHADPLRWSAPPNHTNLSYTVQLLRFEGRWTNFLPCDRTQKTSCNVSTMQDPKPSCVRLRVLAHGHNLTSDPKEACSQQGSSCSPEVQLSSQPGILTVHLHGNHLLIYEYGSAMSHRIYLGQEGGALKEYDDSPSSLVIQELEEGARYCVSVEFVFYSIPFGPRSCVKCQDIPYSGARQLAVTLVLMIFVMAVLVILSLLYFLLFQRQRIKEWMRPPYVEPNCIRDLVPSSPALTYKPIEEQCDRISLTRDLYT